MIISALTILALFVLGFMVIFSIIILISNLDNENHIQEYKEFSIFCDKDYEDFR